MKIPSLARTVRQFPARFPRFLRALATVVTVTAVVSCDSQPPTTPQPSATTAALLSAGSGSSSPPAPTQPPTPLGPTLPFALDVVEVTGSKLPPLQSYNAAQSNGKWLVLGGRTAGLHGFDTGTNNFPRSTANTAAYVIDPVGNAVLGSVDLVANLPANLAGPLTATNSESTQVGAQLYIMGGYGKDLTSGKMTTFGSVIRVDVDGLVGAILAKSKKIASYFKRNATSDNRLKVTGGALKHHAGIFYLVFGQNFDGDYSVHNGDYNRAGGQFQQYTEKVRAFTLGDDLAIKDFNGLDGGYDPSLPYHRRDLNVVDIIGADGKTPAAVVYGGVFMAGQVAGHTEPIDISYGTSVSNATVTLRTGFNQALSQYDCARVSVFDASSTSSFTTLFGGISQYHYEREPGTLVRDALNLNEGIDGLPFIDTVSTIQHKADGFAQFVNPKPLPGLLGAEAQFLPSVKLSKGSGGQLFDNDVINLAAIEARTLVGHVYGGIESFGPYSTYGTPPPSTRASARLFEIHVTPGNTPVLPMPLLPTNTTPYPPPPQP